MDERHIYRNLAQAVEQDQPVALCTVVMTRGSVPRRPGSKMLVYADGTFEGTVGGGELEFRVRQAAEQALQDGRPRYLTYHMVDPQKGDPGVCGGEVHVYIEPVLPPPTLVVVGAGHVGKAVVHLGKWLGWKVVLCDPRAEWCNPERIPGADEYRVIHPSQIPEHLDITPRTYFVLVTPGTQIDIETLPVLLRTPTPYIGVIGSRRRWATTRKALLEDKGIPQDWVDRVVS
ncbi:TPA: XdhC family protein, partial [Candidatus Micrarchaeota archaeon]|nr:XdhC family protein [Candidatus Micrarchaeota archaeon]